MPGKIASSGGFPHQHAPTLLVWLGVAGMTGAYLLIGAVSPELAARLAREDGPVESIGAILFLAAGIGFLVAFRRSRHEATAGPKRRANVFFLLLSLAFFFVFLEEISWGQRLIGFQTPESIREINAQREFNIHNLEIFHGETEDGERKSFWALLLNMDRLFSLFWLSFCCLIPLAYRYVGPVSNLLDKLRMPIVPLTLGAIFFVNYAFSKVLEFALGTTYQHAIVETKEANIGLLFFLLAIWFVQARKRAA